MIRTTLIMAATAAAGFAVGVAPAAIAAAQPKATPVVQNHKVRIIADKYVVVDQEPVVVMSDDHQGKITWELPPKPSPYRFHEDGIAIDADQFLGCRPIADGLKYECTDRIPRSHKLYPYRITVYGPDKNADPLIVDAAVQND